MNFNASDGKPRNHLAKSPQMVREGTGQNYQNSWSKMQKKNSSKIIKICQTSSKLSARDQNCPREYSYWLIKSNNYKIDKILSSTKLFTKRKKSQTSILTMRRRGAVTGARRQKSQQCKFLVRKAKRK